MTFYDTLEAYKNKCEAALAQVKASLGETRESLELLEKQQVIIEAQLMTLDNLMEEPPVVEMPLVEPEDVEEMFDKRLETHDGSSDAEVYKARQDTVYRAEAMEAVEKLDELNRGEEN